MAIVSCPECSKKLKVADTSVGKKVKCSCGNVFVAEAEAAAPVKAAPPAADKVVVACTECGAKLKVGAASLGKKMKCPKCAATFVAAVEEEAAPEPTPPKKPAKPAQAADEDDEINPPAPAKKGKAVSDDDMDDLFSFAQKDAGADAADDDLPPPDDDEEMPKPKGKGKAKKVEEDEDEDDFPKPKSKFGTKKPAKPSRKTADDEDDEDSAQKPVYPSRTLLNLFVLFLLLVFIGGFAVVFLEIVPTGLPKGKGTLSKKKESDEEKKKKRDAEEAAFKGTWIVESAEKDGQPVEALKDAKFIFADGKATIPNVKDGDFDLDLSKDPKKLDISSVSPKLTVSFQGIYEFDGDKLKICAAVSNKTFKDGKEDVRPTKFDSKLGTIYILKREKQDDGKTPKIDNKVEAARLDGDWIIESTMALGNLIEATVGQKITFANGKVMAENLDGPFSVDASKDPKWIELPSDGGFTLSGIYSLDGDTLKYCVGLPKKNAKGVFQAGERPTQFDSKQGILVVMKRAKKVEPKTNGADKKEAAKLNGVWTLTDYEHVGVRNPDLLGDLFTFADGNKLTTKHRDLKDAPFTVDASQDPMTIDIVKGKKTILGVYILDGDTLRLCLGDDRRPTELDSKQGELFTLKRGKKGGVKDPDKEKKEPTDEVKALVAQVQAKTLTQAVLAFRVKNDEFPPALADLLKKDSTGAGPYLESKAALLDPWNKPYQYDPTGPKNGGKQPDIWTVTPEKEIIGNWPSEKVKDKTGKVTSKLDGAWVIESATAKGKADEKSVGESIVFGGGKMIGFGPNPLPITLDLSKDPHWLDITIPLEKEPINIKAIFKFEGEKLRLCFPDQKDPSKRPASLDDKDAHTATLRRATKDDSKYSRSGSANNLKFIGLAFHAFHDSNKHLLAAAISAAGDQTGKPLLSWRVALLPYLEQNELYKEFDLTKPWDDPHNMKLVAKMPKVYEIPGVKVKEGMTHYRALVGPGTLLDPFKGAGGKLMGKYKLFNIPDGSSNVIMVVEAAEPTIWTKPDDLPYDPKGPLPKFGVVPAGFNALFADARVEFVGAKTPETVLRPYLTCDNGMPRQPLDGKEEKKLKEFDKEESKGQARDKESEVLALDLRSELGDRPTWTVPKGWKEAKGSAFTVAAFGIEDKDKKISITVTPLGGKGGGLLANVNRWRMQLKVPVWSEEEFDKAAKKRKIGGIEGHYLELTNEKSAASIYGAIVFRDDQVWFFKLTGDAALANREKDNFSKFLDSVKFK